MKVTAEFNRKLLQTLLYSFFSHYASSETHIHIILHHFHIHPHVSCEQLISNSSQQWWRVSKVKTSNPTQLCGVFRLKCSSDGSLSSWWTAVRVLLCVGVQVYESKLQELQKQVETRSLIAETPDEEELEEEEEEEGVYDWVFSPEEIFLCSTNFMQATKVICIKILFFTFCL